MKRTLFLGILAMAFAGSSRAQAIQVKACPRIVPYYTQGGCTFDNPVIAGDMIVVAGRNSCLDSQLYYLPTACQNISDASGSTFQIAQLGAPYNNYVALSYALDVAGGMDTVNFAAGTNTLVIIAEYPPSYGVDDSNNGSYFSNNPHGDPDGASSDTGSTFVIATQNPGELLIGWGLSNGPLIGDGVQENEDYIITPGPGFTMRAQLYGSFFLEDEITTIPGAYFGTVFFGGYAHWQMAAAAFIMKTPLVKVCP